MKPTTIKIHEESQIMTLTFNRPERHNAFNSKMISEISACIENLKHRSDIRLLIINAEGESFCAGADLGEMQQMVHFTKHENKMDALALANMLKQLYELPQVTVAVVQGQTFGGGVGIVSCCDIVLASSNALFCLSEVKLGLIPSVISPYVIAAIGPRQAHRYFLTAEKFTAEKAWQIGLIHEVAETELLCALKDQMVFHILKNAPLAISAAKKLIAEVVNQSINEDLIENTAEKIANLRISQEGQEGLKAFLEKRPPNWYKKNS